MQEAEQELEAKKTRRKPRLRANRRNFVVNDGTCTTSGFGRGGGGNAIQNKRGTSRSITPRSDCSFEDRTYKWCETCEGPSNQYCFIREHEVRLESPYVGRKT